MSLKVSCLLLAAGRSQRMGRPKQLLKIKEKSFVENCLDTLIAAGLEEIVVVVGELRREIEPLIQRFPVKIVINSATESDMAESVRVGLGAVDDQASGILVCLSDHPLVMPETCKQLVNAHFDDPARILVPTYQSRKGHPSLFPRSLMKQLFSGANLRDITRTHAERVFLLPVEDPGTILDIDTTKDYELIRSQMAKDESHS